MSKKWCVDCMRHRDCYKPVVRTEAGKTLWVCRQCWKKYDYATFMPETSGVAQELDERNLSE